MRFLACELHTHTRHSDGRFSLRELAEAALEAGLSCIAVTDHNTIAAWAEIDAVKAETGMGILRGMELTTFYGHLTTLGIDRYVEWRDLGPADLGIALGRIRAAGGLAVIAHPFRPGNPFCTGCSFDFAPGAELGAEGMEVWSELYPGRRDYNARGMDLWTRCADAGLRPLALYGRDWHGPNQQGPGAADRGAAATFVGIEEGEGPLEAAVLEGLRRGRVCVSLGPSLSLRGRGAAGGRTYGLGDLVPPEDFPLTDLVYELDLSVRPGAWTAEGDSLRIRLEAGGLILDEIELPLNGPPIRTFRGSAKVPRTPWLRATLQGTVDGYSGMIGFTNPIWGA